MPTPIQTRIDEEMKQPRIVQLWWALQPLRTCVNFLNTGAHPDDETTAMLAALALRDGVSIAYACANRGEGGQNDIGTERGAVLGALRTAEMERAADWLNMRLYWLSQSPDDPITDFGFSKSGVESMQKWGRERTLLRFVDIVRTERPDILCPTFLDVPGQHGHHRAMTEAAHIVMDLAADPGFTDSPRAPWQVKKLYLPAWGGGGGSYDDEVPPPEATLTVAAKGRDAVTGWSYERIAQQSRAFHRTQGMGRWIAAGQERDWPLHLVRSEANGPDTAVTDGLPLTLSDYASDAGAEAGSALKAAQAAMDRAITAFPDGTAICQAVAEALKQIKVARQACPDPLKGALLHRLARKEQELSRILYLASGAEVRARSGAIWLRPGDTPELTVEQAEPLVLKVKVTATLELPDGWSSDGRVLSPGTDAMPHDGYRDSYDPAQPPAPRLAVTLTAHGVDATVQLPFETPPVALPARSAAPEPDRAVLNLAVAQRRFDVTPGPVTPADADAQLDTPEGWVAAPQADGAITVTAPKDVAEGLYDLPLMVGDQPAMTEARLAYPHIQPTSAIRPAQLSVRVLSAELAPARIGYLGAGMDDVCHWLRELGADVVSLDQSDLTDTRLAQLDTILIGIFALRFHAGLAPAMPRLHEWCEAGGNLVTLYHRPWDNWDANSTAPRPLEIGQPSLRWRVTDENATVTHLVPDHALLNTPNRITRADWEGWHKERGLYFARSWDAAYVPLLEMADPDEAPHQGALLSAEIGKGRHTHCALILHHQMDHLVPGAFRLMANLVAPAHGGVKDG